MLRGSDRIAHIVQTIENGNEIVVLSGKFLGLGYFEGDSVSDAIAPGVFARRFDGFVVVIESVELGIGKCFGH